MEWRDDHSMDRKKQTLEYYRVNADSFVEGAMKADLSATRKKFTAFLPAGAFILDFGCGPGRDTNAFLEAGYKVDAIDGSPEMCARASEYTGIQVKNMLFNELDARNRYDGVWACASILHLPEEELTEVIRRIETALKNGGIFYTSFKYGEGAKDRGGRFFTDYTEKSLPVYWASVTSMKIIDLWISHDTRPGREEERWTNLLAGKSSIEKDL